MSSLLAEAQRQLAICNACRYCEGYCAVFPALERRREVSEGDLRHLANLCHDCRACLYACMYSPPHEFAVHIPQLLTDARLATYDVYGLARRRSDPDTDDATSPAPGQGAPTTRTLSARLGPLGAAFVAVLALVVVLAGISRGLGALVSVRRHPASPYSVIAYPAIVAPALAAFLVGFAIMLRGAHAYLKDTGGSVRGLLDIDALWRATGYAATLRHLSGGGAGCHYLGERSSAARRRLHLLLSYGFLLCLLSTISAAVTQDVLGEQPPYPLVSVPVLSGICGGVGLVAGCAGIIALKVRSDLEATSREMLLRDYGLLLGLLALGVTGLLSLATRSTPAYGLILSLHLATVLTSFLVASSGKFSHAMYRFIAIWCDNAEQRLSSRRARPPTT